MHHTNICAYYIFIIYGCVHCTPGPGYWIISSLQIQFEDDSKDFELKASPSCLLL